jgi:predicted transcriptional regulator
MKKRDGSQPTPPVLSEEEILSDENLRRIEAEPGFLERMEASIADERAGRVYTHEEVQEALRKGNLKALMEKRQREWRERG